MLPEYLVQPFAQKIRERNENSSWLCGYLDLFPETRCFCKLTGFCEFIACKLIGEKNPSCTASVHQTDSISYGTGETWLRLVCFNFFFQEQKHLSDLAKIVSGKFHILSYLVALILRRNVTCIFCFFRLQQYKIVEMKLLAQQRDLQVLMLFSLDFCRLSSVKYVYIQLLNLVLVN